MSPLTFQVYMKETCSAPSLLREERDTEDAERIANCIRVHSTVLLSYFEKKNSSYVSGVSVCIFVALSVRMCVAGGNKVKGTMLGTNEILASKHDIAALKVKQGHFETAIFGSSQFCRLLLRLKVFRSIKFKYLHNSNAE